MAERQGFEPWEQLPVHRISSAARSTTPAPFPTPFPEKQCKDRCFSFYSKLIGIYFFAIKKEHAAPLATTRSSCLLKTESAFRRKNGEKHQCHSVMYLFNTM